MIGELETVTKLQKYFNHNKGQYYKNILKKKKKKIHKCFSLTYQTFFNENFVNCFVVQLYITRIYIQNNMFDVRVSTVYQLYYIQKYYVGTCLMDIDFENIAFK